MAGVGDGFARFADLFSHPMLLVTNRGRIRGANRAARQQLFQGRAPGSEYSLAQCVAEPHEKLYEYLKLCSRSRQRLPGALTLLNRGEARVFRCDCLASDEREGDERLLLLQLSAKEDAVSRFAALHQRIEQLKHEVGRRLHVERAALEQREAALEQREAALEQREAALERREAALRQADMRKDEFLGMLAHKLRNPLTPLRNAVHILRRQRAAADIPRWADMMDRQTRQLTRLVDDLLDIARITRGAIKLDKRPVPLAAVLEHAFETVRPTIDERGHGLEVQVPSSSPVVEADFARLSQVFCNLLTNAAKFMDPGGRISVSAAAEGDRAIVRVRDDGRGIAPEFLPQVFELFVREERSIDRRQGGLGVGLALAQTLVQMHDGTISAFSEGMGKGSEFIVSLPLADPDRVTPASESPP